MKTHILILLFFMVGFISCENNPNPAPPATEFNIEGKWNLDKYIDLNGEESDKTYTISYWYEQGFEFTSNGEYYPRYDPKLRFDTEEWETNYQVGPGTYSILNDTITLSHKDNNYKYSLSIRDLDTIKLSNSDTSITPLTGTWILIRSNK